VNLDTHIKEGLNHLDVVKDRAKHCPICGSIDFDIGMVLDDWMAKPRRAFDLSQREKGILCSEIMRSYEQPNNAGSIEIHHISYVMDITMPLCIECHSKVHNSNNEPWSKYKPIDKRDDPKHYCLE
jgi:hypothetical protein